MHDSLRPFVIPVLSLRRKNQRNLFSLPGSREHSLRRLGFQRGGGRRKSGRTAQFLQPLQHVLNAQNGLPQIQTESFFTGSAKKGATNLFYHRQTPMSFVGFANFCVILSFSFGCFIQKPGDNRAIRAVR